MNTQLIPSILMTFCLTLPVNTEAKAETQVISPKTLIAKDDNKTLLTFELKCEYDRENETIIRRRTPALHAYLPIASIENGYLVLQGVASLENIPMKIEDSCGGTIYTANLTIGKGETQSISLNELDDEEYILSLSFDEEEYVARFHPVSE